jgi:acetyltransferase-like isoleucine patch superfamily enzyme
MEHIEKAAVTPQEGIQRQAQSTLVRLGPAVMRRLRLVYLRRRFSRALFGARSDIRAGLHLLLGPEARLKVGSACVLDRNMTIECRGVLEIGDRTIFGHHCTLAVRDSLLIGEDCLLAEMVSIRDHDHRFDDLSVPIREQGVHSEPVQIGRNVWLGAKVTVVKGVKIGDNAIIGANAVVTKDIPANAIAAGVPARVIRMRDGQQTN